MVPFADLVDRLRPLLTKWSGAWRLGPRPVVGMARSCNVGLSAQPSVGIHRLCRRVRWRIDPLDNEDLAVRVRRPATVAQDRDW